MYAIYISHEGRRNHFYSDNDYEESYGILKRDCFEMTCRLGRRRKWWGHGALS